MQVLWTADEKIEVARLAACGLSASQIAISMNNGKSRNAVISLCNRRGYRLRGSHGGGPPKRMKMPRKKKAAPVAGFLLKESSQPVMRCQPLPPEPEILEDCQPITLLELTDDTCKFPFGGHDYVFCGRRVLAGSPYCAHHCRISYAPPQPRRSR
jgi:GcrA cell cycle regulator